MPRSDVQHDPARSCHTGLHVGTYEYAHSYADAALLTVLVNPRDVVSVPTACGATKMRVCRYVVSDDQPTAPQESAAVEEGEVYTELVNNISSDFDYHEEFVLTGEQRPPRDGEFYTPLEGAPYIGKVHRAMHNHTIIAKILVPLEV
jgi:hypothetical protein